MKERMSRISDAVNSPSSAPNQGSSFLGGKGKSRANSSSKASSVIAGEKLTPAPPPNGNRKFTPQNSYAGGVGVVDGPSLNQLLGTVDGVPLGSTLPAAVRTRLVDLFGQIVQEFEVLYAENEALHQQLGVQSDRLQGLPEVATVGRVHGPAFASASSSPPSSAGFSNSNELTPTAPPTSSTKASAPTPLQGSSTTSSSTKTTRPIQISQKIKTTYKASQSKILSSFKGGITNPMSTGGNNQVRLFKGHRDGVWDLALSRHSPIVLGTASADFTARIWCMENEACLLQYVGHTGSVNSIRFHPSQDLALTSSGDGTAHLWRAVVSLPSNLELINKCQSSGEEELDGSEDDNLYERDMFNDSVPNSGSFSVSSSLNYPDQAYVQANHSMSPPNSANVLSSNNHQPSGPTSSASQTSIGPHAAPETSFPTVRHPVVVLSGHTDVVVAADWIHGGSQIVTASWDRTANLYDAESHGLVQSLTGHDQELTNVTCHPDQKLIVTSSKDTTFRLWDFRSLHSVNIFQGHSQPVTTAVFAGTDKVVSGSDDRTVRVWDLKNMRAPLTTIRTDSSVNRLTVSRKNWIAIPCDNRHVKLYHLNGERLGRLRRSNRQGHRRMVTSTAWVDSNSPTACNLVTSGFDRKVLGWSVVEISTNKD